MSKTDILVVEDDAVIAMDLQNRLKNFGYSVAGFANDGEKAVEKAAALRPDLVLMDIVLQGEMDGIDAAGIIRSRFGIPVVFLTAHADEERLERAKLATPFGFVHKPFQDRDLKTTIEMARYTFQADAERKQNEQRLTASLQLNRMTENSADEIIDFALEQSILLTDSKIGFINSVDENEEKTIQLSWSKFVMQSCNMETKPTEFTIAHGGVWKEAIQQRKPVLVNDYTSTELLKKGLPDGHVPLSRLMFVPVFDKDRIVLLCAVGNKDTDYDQNDIHQVSLFMEVLWKQIQRKQTEKLLRESEDRFRNLYENAPSGYQSLDAEGRVIDVNQAWLDLLGYPRSEVIGNWFGNFLAPHEIEAYKRRFTQFLAKGEVLADVSMVTSDGSEVIVSINGIVGRNERGQFKQTHCILHDVTERKRTEEKIVKQKKLFETMFNTIPDGVVITNTQREILMANKGMESTFGYKPESLLGRTTEMLYADQTKYRGTGAVLFDKNADKHGDLYVTHYRDKNGRVFPGETFGAKLFDENNQWMGNLGIMRDITEREQAELRLQQAQKMESLGTLAGGIAHDFNNILFPMMGFAELALENAPKNSPLRNHIKEILQGAKRAGDLVKQILTFSRQSQQKPRPLKVQLIVKEVLKLVRSSLPATIAIKHNISNACGLVIADATQLHQVAMNLMTNAYQAMEDEGGVLEVTLKEVELVAGDSNFLVQDRPINTSEIRNPKVTVDLPSGTYACLRVADTGPGVDPSAMDRIFEPYFTTKEDGKGSGLGLAVVHGIVKSFHGDIKVHSEPGKGTAFHVYLPVIKSQVETEASDAVEPAPKGTERILLVDDEEPIVRMEKQMLQRLGYDVTARTSSFEALETFKADPDKFDLVITDMTMSNMTGVQLSQRILEIRPDVPIIICTGFSTKIDDEKAEASGIRGLVMKPIIKSELAQKIRDALDG